MSNYPCGVTGNEYMIAGPDREFTALMLCEECDYYGEVDVMGYRYEEWWVCPECHSEQSRVNEPDYPDLPDDIPNWWEEA